MGAERQRRADRRHGAGRHIDLIEAAIVDLAIVDCTTLTAAGSVAGLLLLQEAALMKVPEPQGEETRTADGFEG